MVKIAPFKHPTASFYKATYRGTFQVAIYKKEEKKINTSYNTLKK